MTSANKSLAKKNFPSGWKCYKTIGSYVSCAFIEIWSTREVWRALKKLELLSATPRIFRALQTSRVLHISMNARWCMNQLLINKTLNSQSKLLVASKKGKRDICHLFFFLSNYRMRGHLVRFHFYPILLSGVALFFVAFSSSLHTDLSTDEVFERVEGNTWMCYTSVITPWYFFSNVLYTSDPPLYSVGHNKSL